MRNVTIRHITTRAVVTLGVIAVLGAGAKTGAASGQAVSVFYDRILPAVRH
jgi:hypothetical protein